MSDNKQLTEAEELLASAARTGRMVLETIEEALRAETETIVERLVAEIKAGRGKQS